MQTLDQPDTLSGSLVARVRAAVHDGSLADGERVNEVHLAAQLGVSRTPLREALSRLVSEQILVLRPRHGYFVPALSPASFEAEYGIRPILDLAALRLQGLPTAAIVHELEQLNATLQSARSFAEQIDIDDAFHLALLRDCPNPVLLDLIRTMMVRTRRYEFAYFRECAPMRDISDQHGQIVAALRQRNLDAACDALRLNLTSGLQPMRDWLSSRNRSEHK
jgi:DNA-binding GntR family transcriptional regulator